jgi:hypothetical protein
MPFETLDHLALDALRNKAPAYANGAVEKTRKPAEKPYFAGFQRSNVVGLSPLGFNRLAPSGPTLRLKLSHIFQPLWITPVHGECDD